MSKLRAGSLIVVAMVMLGGCQKKEAAPVSTINTDMTEVMEPNAETIWDTMSQAYNEKGDALDGSKLSDADWSKIGDAAAKLRDRAQQIADNADHIVVATKDQTILGQKDVGQKTPAGPAWDPVGPAFVQKKIDADPKGFAKKARELVESADAMHRAAMTKDTVLLYKWASNLDEVCDSCHEPFWGTDEPPTYPDNPTGVRVQ